MNSRWWFCGTFSIYYSIFLDQFLSCRWLKSPSINQWRCEAQLDSTIAWLETTRQAQQQLIQQLQCHGSESFTSLMGIGWHGVVHPCYCTKFKWFVNWMELDGIGWNWMELDGIGWNWMELDGIGWNWMELDGIGWKLDGIGWNWMEIGWNWMELDGIGWNWMNWMELDGIGWNWMEIGWNWWNWMELDGIGWNWMELDGIGWMDGIGWWKLMSIDVNRLVHGSKWSCGYANP